MLLRPDAHLFARIVRDLHNVHGHQRNIVPPDFLMRIRNYNSPDADFFTELADYRGKWRSLDLRYNFQLEFDIPRIDIGKLS